VELALKMHRQNSGNFEKAELTFHLDEILEIIVGTSCFENSDLIVRNYLRKIDCSCLEKVEDLVVRNYLRPIDCSYLEKVEDLVDRNYLGKEVRYQDSQNQDNI